MRDKTVKEYVKTRDLTKSLIVKCNNIVIYNSKHNTLEQYLKIADREILNVHVGKTLIGLNVKEDVSD